MHNDKAKEKFNIYREKMKTQDENVALIAYYKERYRYIFRNKAVPIDAMKIWIDRGKGLEEVIAFKDANTPGMQNFSMLIKDEEKVIFKDQCEIFHAFGIKDVETEWKKLIAFFKIGNSDVIIFASAETNSVEILMKRLRIQKDAIMACLFESQNSSVSGNNSDGVDFNELFL